VRPNLRHLFADFLFFPLFTAITCNTPATSWYSRRINRRAIAGGDAESPAWRTSPSSTSKLSFWPAFMDGKKRLVFVDKRLTWMTNVSVRSYPKLKLSLVAHFQASTSCSEQSSQ